MVFSLAQWALLREGATIGEKVVLRYPRVGTSSCGNSGVIALLLIRLWRRIADLLGRSTHIHAIDK